MKRTGRSVFSAMAMAAVMIGSLPLHRAIADDETNDTEIKIQAVLDAVSCDSLPPTITVLGMTIDVSTAQIESPGISAPDPTPEAGDDGTHHHGGGSTDPLPGGCYYCPAPTPVPTAAAPSAVQACAALVVGQPVEVTLASDNTPLVATAVKQDGERDLRIEIEAPLQGIDATAQTISILGLTIEVGSAELNGADDESNDGNSQPIDLSQLMVGQFVEVRLDPSDVPFKVTELEMKNFTNQVRVEFDDASGNQVADVDDARHPVDDIQVDIVETIGVQKQVGATETPQRVRKVLRLRTTSNGTVVLSGLASGLATIQVARLNHGVVSRGRRSFPVKGNATRFVRVRLRQVSLR